MSMFRNGTALHFWALVFEKRIFFSSATILQFNISKYNLALEIHKCILCTIQTHEKTTNSRKKPTDIATTSYFCWIILFFLLSWCNIRGFHGVTKFDKNLSLETLEDALFSLSLRFLVRLSLRLPFYSKNWFCKKFPLRPFFESRPIFTLDGKENSPIMLQF